jgi:glucose dehydrogenase
MAGEDRPDPGDRRLIATVGLLDIVYGSARNSDRFTTNAFPRKSKGRHVIKSRQVSVAAAVAAAMLVGMSANVSAADVDAKRMADADKNPADWLTYHGTYKSWHHSALDQINAGNVKDLKVAWSHATPRSTRGLQSFPLVADGILYYSVTSTWVRSTASWLPST